MALSAQLHSKLLTQGSYAAQDKDGILAIQAHFQRRNVAESVVPGVLES